MGRFRGVLLATDYDDTLYSTNATISPENRQAIEYFVAEGGKFCISTGRSYINFAIQMEKERLPVNAPVILSNGASIYDFATEESLWLKHLPPLAPRHLAQVCRAFPQVGFEAYHQDEVFTFRANEVTRHHLTRCHLTGVPRAIEAMPVPWIKVILQHPDPGMLQPLPAGGHRQGGQQGPVGAVGGQPPPGEAAGHLLRGQWAQRHPHAPGVRPVLRPGQQLPRRPGGGGCGPPLLRRELRGGDDPPAGGALPPRPLTPEKRQGLASTLCLPALLSWEEPRSHSVGTAARNRISTAAIWAREAVPWGRRLPSSKPSTRPWAWAQDRASWA